MCPFNTTLPLRYTLNAKRRKVNNIVKKLAQVIVISQTLIYMSYDACLNMYNLIIGDHVIKLHRYLKPDYVSWYSYLYYIVNWFKPNALNSISLKIYLVAYYMWLYESEFSYEWVNKWVTEWKEIS